MRLARVAQLLRNAISGRKLRNTKVVLGNHNAKEKQRSRPAHTRFSRGTIERDVAASFDFARNETRRRDRLDHRSSFNRKRAIYILARIHGVPLSSRALVRSIFFKSHAAIQRRREYAFSDDAFIFSR